MERKANKSLLERYGIPINHLDFKYIGECTDAREMEKIVHILRSNEEGYFPDLTLCAENKLKELKPQSRLFRREEKIKGREALTATELKPIYDWNSEIKSTDKKLQKLVDNNQNVNCTNEQMPPIRKMGRIQQKPDKENKNVSDNIKKVGQTERIKSTEYEKWDKYDPEEEILRMDLAEERQQEEVERKNRLNAEKFKKQPLEITEFVEEQELKGADKKLSMLSDIEKEKLSEEFRLRGNEYFRAKDYDHAVAEYTKAIQAFPNNAAAAYNNRALTYFKLQRFLDSINDCRDCLKLEPNNLKARLRLAEANYAYGRRRESYQLYANVLELDANNSVALKATMELRKQFENLPPPNATRLKIQDESSKTIESKVEENCKLSKKAKPKSINYDLADLVKPNRLVKNKLFHAAETFGKKVQNTGEKKQVQDKNQVISTSKLHEQDSNIMELCLPGSNSTKVNKPLIEEL